MLFLFLSLSHVLGTFFLQQIKVLTRPSHYIKIDPISLYFYDLLVLAIGECTLVQISTFSNSCDSQNFGKCLTTIEHSVYKFSKRTVESRPSYKPSFGRSVGSWVSGYEKNDS